MPTSNDARTVTERVLSILDAFSRTRPELSLGEIARRANLSPATAHRRVQELEGWGALEKGANGKYRIGLRLWELAALAPRGLPLRELALPFLEDLVAVTKGNGQLAVRTGSDALFIERLRGETVIDPVASVADRLPLTLTAVGLTLLAHAPKVVQEEVLAGPVMQVTPKTVTSPLTLRRMLSIARRDGYATSSQQLTVGTYSVAAPIFDEKNEVIAALGVVITDYASEGKRALGMVLGGARSLSRLLGAEVQRTSHQARVGEMSHGQSSRGSIAESSMSGRTAP
jgi:DNA-binding IclR family transcriptional regulator